MEAEVVKELEVNVEQIGPQGYSAYEVYVQNGGTLSETDWLESLKGENGITPTIGDNGNWYLGDVDTGKPSRGEISSDVDLSGYATKEDLHNHDNKDVLDKITQEDIDRWNSGSSGGNTGGGDAITHGIIYDLVNVTSSSSIVSIADGTPYITILTAKEGYTLGDVTVTMGGEVLTGVWNADTSTLTIMSVTGDVMISCVASQGVDTSPVIAEYDKGLGQTMEANRFPGMCITQIYTFTPDIETLKESSYYDVTNDYLTTAGINGGFVVCTPRIKFTEAGYSGSGMTTKASKIVLYTDGVAGDYFSNSSVTTSSQETNFNLPRQKTVGMYANGIAFTLSILDIDDSYVYWYKPNTNTILPIGIREGDIIFAGKNTPYYGMANIDGTKPGETATTGILSFDDDIAMNYSIATTSILGDEIAKDTNTAYGLSSTFANVIDEAKKEWMLEYGGDYRKIPIIVSTDQHGRRNSGIFNMIGKTVSMHDVSKVMNLGDTISTWYDSNEKPLISDAGLEAWCESVKAIPFSKQLNVFGNHDTWYGNYEDEGNPIATRYPSSQAHLDQYFRNIYARRTNNNGWFVTYDDRFNVKYLVVSAFEYRNGVSFRIGTDQMNFIIEEMSKNDGYDIVIISHVPLKSDPNLFIYPTGQTSTEVGRVSELDTDALFSARKTKGIGSITDSDGVEHNYDFTNCNTQLLCSLHGHTHYDAYLYLNDSLLVNSFDWFDDSTFFFVLIDRINEQLNVWKVSNPSEGAKVENYQIPFNKPIE